MKATAVNGQPFEQGKWMSYWHVEDAYLTLVADSVCTLCAESPPTAHWCFKRRSPDLWFQLRVTDILHARGKSALLLVLLCVTLHCRQLKLCFKDDMKAPDWKVDDSSKRLKSIG